MYHISIFFQRLFAVEIENISDIGITPETTAFDNSIKLLIVKTSILVFWRGVKFF